MTRPLAPAFVLGCLLSLAACATGAPVGDAPRAVATGPVSEAASPLVADPPVASEPSPAAAPGAAAADALSAGAEGRFDATRVLGRRIEIGNLTVWPVLLDAPGAADAAAASFVSLTDALRARDAGVWMSGSDVAGLSLAQRFRSQQAIRAHAGAAATASVRGVVIDNGGKLPLYVPAGTLLCGGDQDRVVAGDMIVPADTAVVAAVYCVEQGRSDTVRAGRDTAGRFEAMDVIAAAAIRSAGQYEKSQGDVWNRVAAANRTASASRAAASPAAPTGDAADTGSLIVHQIERVPGDARRARAAAVDQLVRRFEALAAEGARPVGFAYAIDGRAVGVRAFANPALLRACLPSFAGGMVAEAANRRPAPGVVPPAARAEDAVMLVRAVEATRHATVTDRTSYRVRVVRSPKAWGSACIVKLDGRELTVAEDWTAR